MQREMKRDFTIKKVIILIALIVLVTILLFPYNVTHIYEKFFSEDDYYLQILNCNDIELQEEKYIVTGSDAYIVFDLGEERSLYNGQISLDEELESPISLQVFYIGTEEEYSEDNSYYTSIEKGEDSIIISLPNKDVRYLRIDICEEEGTSFPAIGKMTATQRTVGLYVKLFFSSYNMLLMFFIAIIMFIAFKIVRHRQVINEFIEKHEYLSAFLIIGICASIVYWGYICGEKYYVFYDVASDSLYQTYPSLLNIAERIQAGEWGTQFDFSLGLGSPVNSIIIGLDNWVSLFGKNNVAYLMGIGQWMKVILAGMFAYAFAREYGNKHKVALIVGLGYAFNAEIMLRGSWNSYPNMALMLIIWLTAFEIAYSKKNLMFFPIATICFFYAIDIYYCVFWGVVLGAYIVFRIISENKISKNILTRLCKVEFVYVVFAIFGMADTVISKISTVTGSSRFNDNVNGFSSLDMFSTAGDLFTALLRTVGLSITGITEDYTGVGNILADPTFYCGIFVLILVPFSIYCMNKRQRIFYILLYVAMGIYLLIVPIRYISNGFAGFAWKYNGIWVIAVIVVTSLHGLRVISKESEKIPKNGYIVLDVTIVLILIGLVSAYCFGYVARIDQWIISIILILAYGAIMNLILLQKISFHQIGSILCFCAMIEVMVLSWDCVNDRVVITEEQMVEGVFYNGDAQNAVNYLKETDQGLYRIENTNKIFLCDSLAQGYNGITAYIGGTGIDNNTYNVYRTLGLISQENNYLFGSGGNIYLDSLLGVKYFFVNSGELPTEYGLSYVETIGNIDIYENELAMPIAYTVADAMAEADFMEYSVSDRREILLENCILECDSGESVRYTDDRRIYKIEAIEEGNQYHLEVPENSVLIIRPKTQRAYIGKLYYEDENQTVHMRYFSAQCDNEIEICATGVMKIWFEVRNSTEIENVEFYHQNADEYYAIIREKIDALKKNSLQIEEYSESHIQGRIVCEEDTVLVTSIPYNEKWHIIVDGNELDTVKVNVGFLGAELSAGEHTVEMYYETSSWIYENKFKSIGFAIALMFMIGVYVKGRKSNEKNIGCSSNL